MINGTIRKVPAVQEDLLIGVGSDTQIRQGQEVPVSRIPITAIVKTYLELSELDTEKFKTGAVYLGSALREYFYSPESTEPVNEPAVLPAQPAGRWILKEGGTIAPEVLAAILDTNVGWAFFQAESGAVELVVIMELLGKDLESHLDFLVTNSGMTVAENQRLLGAELAGQVQELQLGSEFQISFGELGFDNLEVWDRLDFAAREGSPQNANNAIVAAIDANPTAALDALHAQTRYDNFTHNAMLFGASNGGITDSAPGNVSIIPSTDTLNILASSNAAEIRAILDVTTFTGSWNDLEDIPSVVVNLQSELNAKADNSYVDSQLALKVNTSAVGVASGIAQLDANGKVPLAQINDAILGQVSYQGAWNASANTPTLPDPATVKGHYYVTDVAGTQFGLEFGVGDWAISNGVEWQKVDNTDAVQSVAGRTGAITLTSADLTDAGNSGRAVLALSAPGVVSFPRYNTNGTVTLRTASEYRSDLGVSYGTSAGTVAEGNDSRLSNSREWTAETISRAEAEAGTANTRRAWTSQRVRQAIVAWWNGVTSAFGRAFVAAADAAAGRSALGLGSAAQRDVTTNSVNTADGLVPILRNNGGILGLGATTGVADFDSVTNISALPCSFGRIGDPSSAFSVATGVNFFSSVLIGGYTTGRKTAIVVSASGPPKGGFISAVGEGTQHPFTEWWTTANLAKAESLTDTTPDRVMITGLLGWGGNTNARSYGTGGYTTLVSQPTGFARIFDTSVLPGTRHVLHLRDDAGDGFDIAMRGANNELHVRSITGGVASSFANVWTGDSLVKTTSHTDGTVGRMLSVGNWGLGSSGVGGAWLGGGSSGFFTSLDDSPVSGVTVRGVKTVVGSDVHAFASRNRRYFGLTAGAANGNNTAWDEFWTTGNTSANVQTFLASANNAAMRTNLDLFFDASGVVTAGSGAISNAVSNMLSANTNAAVRESIGALAESDFSGAIEPDEFGAMNLSEELAWARLANIVSTGLNRQYANDIMVAAGAFQPAPVRAAIGAAKKVTLVTISGSTHNLEAANESAYHRFTFSGAKSVTVRPNSSHVLPDNGSFVLRNANTGSLTIVAGSGVTINPGAGGTLVIEPNGTATLQKVGTNVYDLIGA